MKTIHALKMKHVQKVLAYGRCLAIFNEPGITEGVGKVPAVVLINIDVRKLSPGQKRRNYSNMATAILIATVMGKPVRG